MTHNKDCEYTHIDVRKSTDNKRTEAIIFNVILEFLDLPRMEVLLAINNHESAVMRGVETREWTVEHLEVVAGIAKSSKEREEVCVRMVGVPIERIGLERKIIPVAKENNKSVDKTIVMS